MGGSDRKGDRGSARNIRVSGARSALFSDASIRYGRVAVFAPPQITSAREKFGSGGIAYPFLRGEQAMLDLIAADCIVVGERRAAKGSVGLARPF